MKHFKIKTVILDMNTLDRISDLLGTISIMSDDSLTGSRIFFKDNDFQSLLHLR